MRNKRHYIKKFWIKRHKMKLKIKIKVNVVYCFFNLFIHISQRLKNIGNNLINTLRKVLWKRMKKFISSKSQ